MRAPLLQPSALLHVHRLKLHFDLSLKESSVRTLVTLACSECTDAATTPTKKEQAE